MHRAQTCTVNEGSLYSTAQPFSTAAEQAVVDMKS